MSVATVNYSKIPNGTNVTMPTILIKKGVQLQAATTLNGQFQLQQNAVQKPIHHLQIVKSPFIKLPSNHTGLVINKIPAIIKPIMKRGNSASDSEWKPAKCALQTVDTSETQLNSIEWQQGAEMRNVDKSNATNNIEYQIHAQKLNTFPSNTNITAASNAKDDVEKKINGNNVSNMETTEAGVVTESNNCFNSILAKTNQKECLSEAASNTSSPFSNNNRRTVFIKRDAAKRCIRTVTLDLIEKNPLVHIGVDAAHLPLVKSIISRTADVSLVDMYLTLKKLRQNEDFALLAEYFEMSESDVQKVFARSIIRLAKYLRYLICWPDSKRYYDRHKNVPFAFRQNLSHVQSLVECVEVDFAPNGPQIECTNYKFILSINTNGIISYISEAFKGHCDDLSIFSASGFKNCIPDYLSLFVDPGKAVRRLRKSKQEKKQEKRMQHAARRRANNRDSDASTDSADEASLQSLAAAAAASSNPNENPPLNSYKASRLAGELASHRSLTVVNNELTSKHTKDIRIPTMHVREPICRMQIRHMINCLREYKILQPQAISEPLIYQCLNEVLIVCAALLNLQS